jgi:hypothetical protein
MITECGAAIVMNSSSGNGQQRPDINAKGVDDDGGIAMGISGDSAMDSGTATMGNGGASRDDVMWSDLGSNIHVTDAKVADAYDVCNHIKLALNTKIAGISVDNAVSKVAECAAKKLNADGDPAVPLHNPAHCIDLLYKDLAKTSVVCSVWTEAKEVFELCRPNQIENIRKELIDAGDILLSIVA